MIIDLERVIGCFVEEENQSRGNDNSFQCDNTGVTFLGKGPLGSLAWEGSSKCHQGDDVSNENEIHLFRSLGNRLEVQIGAYSALDDFISLPSPYIHQKFRGSENPAKVPHQATNSVQYNFRDRCTNGN